MDSNWDELIRQERQALDEMRVREALDEFQQSMPAEQFDRFVDTIRKAISLGLL